MEPAHARELLASIDDDRLVIICGAGLSMPRPSLAPSAAALAQSCADSYEAATGQQVEPEIRVNLESLAEFFLSAPPLSASFRDRYIDWARFTGEPNAGHLAIADLLGCRAAQAAISTNIDVFVERAAERLGESDFRAAVEGDEATRHCQHSPFLKIHGSMSRNRSHILWCHGQIANGPLREAFIVEQLEIWRVWMSANLQGRDLVIIGFWSDWSYLNDVLARALIGIEPALVSLVDPAAPEDLKAKAPGLWELATKTGHFRHIRESGAEFLAELRRLFSRVFLRNVLREGVSTYEAITGDRPLPPDIPEGLALDELYDLRRDVCGVAPTKIVRCKQPQAHMKTVGAIHLLLQARGAHLNGSRYMDGDRRVRIVNGAGQVLSLVKAEFSPSQPRSGRPEIVICDAQADGSAPTDILRGDTPTTVVRAGSDAEWITFQRARELGYC